MKIFYKPFALGIIVLLFTFISFPVFAISTPDTPTYFDVVTRGYSQLNQTCIANGSVLFWDEPEWDPAKPVDNYLIYTLQNKNDQNPTLIGTLGLTKRYENTHQGVFGIKAKNSIGTSGMLVGDIADNGPDSCVLTDVTLYTATSVSASLNTNNQPVITWQAPQDTSGIGTHPQPFQGYKVYRGTQKGNSVAVSNLITTTTFTDTTPLAAGTYYYYVRALYSPVISGNPLYEAHYSNNATVVITSDTIPTFDYSLSNGGNRYITPGSSVINPVTATLVGGITSPVTLSISSITNSSGTNVYNQTNGITASFDTNPINPTASSDVTLNAGAGTPAGIYTVNVNGIASSLTRTTPFTLTVDTTNLVLVNGSTLNGGGNANCNTGSVVLTWNITPGVDHYVIYKAIGAGATSTLASVDQPTSGTTVTYTDDNLVPGAYTYYVEGFDKKNNGKVISWSQPQTMIATSDTSKCLVCELSASPTSISSGDSSTLTWSSFNANSCSVSGTGYSSVNGTGSVKPSATTKYTLTCQNPAQTPNSCTSDATVTVTPARFRLWLNNDSDRTTTTIQQGKSVGLNWKADNTTIPGLSSGTCSGVVKNSSSNNNIIVDGWSSQPLEDIRDNNNQFDVNIDQSGKYDFYVQCKRRLRAGGSIDTVTSEKATVTVTNISIEER